MMRLRSWGWVLLSRSVCGKKSIYAIENLRGRVGQMNLTAKLAAVSHAVREPAGELLHLADGIGQFGFHQTEKISGKQPVTIRLGGLIVTPAGSILLHLAENPGICRRRTPNHYCVAPCFANHLLRIPGSVDISIADHGHAHAFFYGANNGPIRPAIQPLQAGSRVDGNGFDADLFGHAGHFGGDNTLLVPAGADLDGQRDADRRTDRAPDPFRNAACPPQSPPPPLPHSFPPTPPTTV